MKGIILEQERGKERGEEVVSVHTTERLPEWMVPNDDEEDAGSSKVEGEIELSGAKEALEMPNKVPQSYSSHKDWGWRVGPEDGAWDETNIYPWISQEEMQEVLTWGTNLPESAGKHFFVHALDEGTIGITIIASVEEPSVSTEDSEKVRVLIMWRNRDGDWIAIPQHAVCCAWGHVTNR